MTFRTDQSLDTLNARSIGRLPGLVGIRFTGIEEGMVAAELDIRPDLIAPNGYLHAATVIALADTACGYGCIAHLPDGMANFTTVELKMNFLRPFKEGHLVAEGWVVNGGRRLGMTEAEVRDDRGRLIAKASSTCMTLRADVS